MQRDNFNYEEQMQSSHRMQDLMVLVGISIVAIILAGFVSWLLFNQETVKPLDNLEPIKTNANISLELSEWQKSQEALTNESARKIDELKRYIRSIEAAKVEVSDDEINDHPPPLSLSQQPILYK